MIDRSDVLILPALLATITSAGLALAQNPPADCPLHDKQDAKESVGRSPYAGYEARDIKALSEAQQEQLLAGHGMGLALAAELNRYPGPKHVLELASALELTERQIRDTRDIFHEMQTRAQALGREIIDAEAALDARFAAADVDEVTLTKGLRNIGRLQADLRLAHLRAHLRMRDSLSEKQISRYDELRGYGSALRRTAR